MNRKLGFGHPAAAHRLDGEQIGRRVTLRPLRVGDFDDYADARLSNEDWLLPWEPQRADPRHDPWRSREAFAMRCSQRERERHNGVSYGFGLFVGEQFAGEVNINSVLRGAFQSATIGYWIDRRFAGHRYVPEGVAVALCFAFEVVDLHRIEICIVPRNTRSHRVVEVIGLRHEGLATRFLEINGVWEDHVRYAITTEEWQQRRDELSRAWLDRQCPD